MKKLARRYVEFSIEESIIENDWEENYQYLMRKIEKTSKFLSID